MANRLKPKQWIEEVGAEPLAESEFESETPDPSYEDSFEEPSPSAGKNEVSNDVH